jgi:hypothetical protein
LPFNFVADLAEIEIPGDELIDDVAGRRRIGLHGEPDAEAGGEQDGGGGRPCAEATESSRARKRAWRDRGDFFQHAPPRRFETRRRGQGTPIFLQANQLLQQPPAFRTSAHVLVHLARRGRQRRGSFRLQEPIFRLVTLHLQSTSVAQNTLKIDN